MGPGSKAQGEARTFARAVQHGQQKSVEQISLSRFAALLDCSSMHDNVHCECRDRSWPFGLGRGESFTVSRLQGNTSSTAASALALIQFSSRGQSGRVAALRSRPAHRSERPVGGFEAQRGDEIGALA